MHIKFLPHGGGSARKAVAYLLGEKDHKGEVRAHVEVLRGDPQQFAELTDSLGFAQKYTSGVIAWAGEDQPTRSQMDAVLEDYHRLALSGLDADRHCWVAILHQEQSGSWHIHTLHARVDLETGLSHNIAPPRQQKGFDHLRDHYNYLNDWTRPDDPSRARLITPPHIGAAQQLRDLFAEPETIVSKSSRVQAMAMVTGYVQQLVIDGKVNNRQEVVAALAEIGNITRQGEDYISIELPGFKSAIRLKGALYESQFTRGVEIADRREDAADRSDHPVSGDRVETDSQLLSAEARGRLEQAIARRREYNLRYYQARTTDLQPELEPDDGSAKKPDRVTPVADSKPAQNDQTVGSDHFGSGDRSEPDDSDRGLDRDPERARNGAERDPAGQWRNELGVSDQSQLDPMQNASGQHGALQNHQELGVEHERKRDDQSFISLIESAYRFCQSAAAYARRLAQSLRAAADRDRKLATERDDARKQAEAERAKSAAAYTNDQQLRAIGTIAPQAIGRISHQREQAERITRLLEQTRRTTEQLIQQKIAQAEATTAQERKAIDATKAKLAAENEVRAEANKILDKRVYQIVSDFVGIATDRRNLKSGYRDTSQSWQGLDGTVSRAIDQYNQSPDPQKFLTEIRQVLKSDPVLLEKFDKGMKEFDQAIRLDQSRPGLGW